MLSMHDNEEFFLQALQAGADGYLLKSAVDYRAHRRLPGGAARRGRHFRRRRRTLIRYVLNRSPTEDRSEALSPRELEILELIREGHSGRQVAEQLTISEKPVERHRSNILAKLGLTDRLQLTRRAIIEP